MSEINNYIEANKERFLEELKELLRIPSVSAVSSYNDQVKEAAEMVRTKMEEAGVDKAEVCPTEGHPIVYGEKLVDNNAPTVLVYGHYDVQPPEPLELWKSDPFEPEVRDEKIFARGASDDKGQMFIH
ncbi:MAG: M20/M25/M40 family metallo-hydrolase, partial [Flavobacteriales bacterium]